MACHTKHNGDKDMYRTSQPPLIARWISNSRNDDPSSLVPLHDMPPTRPGLQLRWHRTPIPATCVDGTGNAAEYAGTAFGQAMEMPYACSPGSLATEQDAPVVIAEPSKAA